MAAENIASNGRPLLPVRNFFDNKLQIGPTMVCYHCWDSNYPGIYDLFITSIRKSTVVDCLEQGQAGQPSHVERYCAARMVLGTWIRLMVFRYLGDSSGSRPVFRRTTSLSSLIHTLSFPTQVTQAGYYYWSDGSPGKWVKGHGLWSWVLGARHLEGLSLWHTSAYSSSDFPGKDVEGGRSSSSERNGTIEGRGFHTPSFLFYFDS